MSSPTLRGTASSGFDRSRRNVIEVTDLTKSYDEVQALAGVDLTVEAGTVFALLGPNGAGKTSLIRILATLSAPDSGWATVCGYDVVHQPREVRASISLTGQFASLDLLQTGQENLVMMARLTGMSRRDACKRADELLMQFDLAEVSRRRTVSYSGGTRRRLDLAVSLIRQPAILFLDEPTTGIDVLGRRIVWDVVATLVRSGVSIFLTTQYLEEADRLADQIALIHEGRIIASGTASDLKARIGSQRLDVVARDRLSVDVIRRRLGDSVLHEVPDDRILGFATDGSARNVRKLLDDIDPDRTAVAEFFLTPVTLDDVFVALTLGERQRQDSGSHS